MTENPAHPLTADGPDPSARTRSSARWDDPRLRAWIAFLQTHAAVSRRLEAELQAAGGVSLAEYDALVQLATSDGQRLRMSELAERVLLSRSGVSRLVDRLEEHGLVERATCPTDARGAWAILAPRGLEALRAATPVHLRGVETHFLGPIGDADGEALVRALGAVMARLRGPTPQPIPCPDPSSPEGRTDGA